MCPKSAVQMSTMACYILFLVLLFVLETLPQELVCMRLPDIYWNSSNPIFRIDNTDHIIDVNKGNIPFEYDQVNIICPVYTPGTHEEDAEKYIIYNVSKEEYDTCRITNPNPKIIAICDKPYKLMYFTITFRSFTPQPGGLEFRPGQDYYFISTSSKDDLHRRVGGRCSTHNMKVVFKVCCRPEDMLNKTVTVSNQHPALMPVTIRSTTSTSTTTTSSTTTTTSTPRPSSTTSRVTSYKEFDVPSFNVKATTKKSKEFEKHPNEVLKNEELTYNSALRVSNHPVHRLVQISLSMVFLSHFLTEVLLMR